MGVMMRMRDNYRRQWSGPVGFPGPRASWTRFTCYTALFLLMLAAFVAGIFAKRPRPNLAAPVMATIFFGVAAARQWKNLRRWHPTPPGRPQKPRA